MAIIQAYPFTATMLVLVAVCGLLTQSHLGPLTDHNYREYGFAPIHLSHFKLVRLLSSALLTAGGAAFFGAIVMVLVCVGGAETIYGWRRTAAIFWGVHFATLIGASLMLILPLHQLKLYLGVLLANAHDVGPSAGYYGCLGALCRALPGSARIVIATLIVASLVARLTWSLTTVPNHGRTISADLAHMIALPLGWLAAECCALPSALPR